jgi:hypothetical protein
MRWKFYFVVAFIFLGLQVDLAVTHPGYDADTVDNDVALLRLPTEVRPDKYRGIACLPRHEQELPPAHRLCTIIGWGKKRSSDAFGTDILHEARVFLFVLSRPYVISHLFFSGENGKNTLFWSNIFQKHSVLLTIGNMATILSDNAHHSLFSPFHLTPGSATLTAFPICHESGSTCFT